MPNANPDLIGYQNGVLNKKTGEFFPNNINLFLRGVEDFECNISSKETPYFKKWLDFVRGENNYKKMAILAGLYMVLTNRHEWGLFLEITGTAGAGKSIFGEIATLLNGRTNTTVISLQGFDNANERASLVGKTLAYSPDQPQYKGSGDGLKAVTGGDLIKIKHLYKDFADYRPNAVFIMSTNYSLIFTDRNGGIARRRVTIPFTRAVPKEEKDVHFIDKIKKEVYGITHLLLNLYETPEQARKWLEYYQNDGKLHKQG